MNIFPDILKLHLGPSAYVTELEFRTRALRRRQETTHGSRANILTMYPNWKDEDPNNFARVRDTRMPAVHQASRTLQSTVGIALGTKMIGEASVLLWQMPEPPSQTTAQMFEDLKANIGMVAKKQTKASNSKEATTKINNNQASPARKSSLNSRNQNQHQSQLSRPASPPPSWISNARTMGSKHIPAYWSHTLSSNIGRWLEQPGTKSCQISLLELSLCGVSQDGQTSPLISIHAEQYGKVKLSRLSLPLPIAAKAIPKPSQLVEWLVLQVSFRDGHGTINQAGQNNSEYQQLQMGITPHFIIAFPLQAITEQPVEYGATPFSQLPLQMLPSPLRRERSKLDKQIERDERGKVIHITRLTIGYTGRIPVVHGRGVDPLFAQRFVQACAEGKGVVELRSWESILTMLK